MAGDETIELRLDAGRELRVTVPVIEGIDLTRRTVWLRRRRDPDGVGAYFQLDLPNDGSLRFLGLEPGERYRLWCHLEAEGLYALHEIAAGEKAVEVVFREGGVVEGRVMLPLNAEEASVRVVEPGVYARTDVRVDGSFTLRTLPPGAWLLEARCKVRCKVRYVRRTTRSPAPVRAGETVHLDLRSP